MNLHPSNHALAMRLQLAHDNARLREALALIADLAEGSRTANSLPNIARVARAALVSAPRGNPSLQTDKSPR
jgi:hypothetical protein